MRERGDCDHFHWEGKRQVHGDVETVIIFVDRKETGPVRSTIILKELR